MANPNRKLINLTGQVFGRLTVLGESDRHGGARTWNCSCVCGSIVNVFQNNLRSGKTLSCGCWQQESRSTHTRTHGLSGTPEHKIWVGINTRCFNPKVACFDRYGGRGIRVCVGWRNDFTRFLGQMGKRPKGYTIERVNNDGHYSCGECAECVENGWVFNCEWKSRRAQAQNTRRNRLVTANGETLCVSEWARRLGMEPTSVFERIQEGWSEHDAVTIPPRRWPSHLS